MSHNLFFVRQFWYLEVPLHGIAKHLPDNVPHDLFVFTGSGFLLSKNALEEVVLLVKVEGNRLASELFNPLRYRLSFVDPKIEATPKDFDLTLPLVLF